MCLKLIFSWLLSCCSEGFRGCAVKAPLLAFQLRWVALKSLSECSAVTRWFLGACWLGGGSPVVVRGRSMVFLCLLGSVIVLWLLCGCSLLALCFEVVHSEVIRRLLSNYPDTAVCLFSGCCRLPPGCSLVAFRLLSGCYQVAVRLRSDCSQVAFRVL